MSFIRVTLDFETAAQAAHAMALLAGTAQPAATGNVTEPAKASSKKPAASADAGEKTEAKSTASKESAAKPEPEKKPEADKPVEPFPYVTLQNAVMELVALDPTGPKAILEHFGIPTFKGSDPAIWEEAKTRLEKATAVLKAAKDAA